VEDKFSESKKEADAMIDNLFTPSTCSVGLSNEKIKKSEKRKMNFKRPLAPRFGRPVSNHY